MLYLQPLKTMWDLLTTEEDSVKLLQKLGILPDSRTCKNEHGMELYPTDGFVHRTNIKKQGY